MSEHDDLLRSVFDAMPSLVFVVDEDVRIREYNAAASTLIGDERSAVLKQRAGQVLRCVHSTDVPEGCGRGGFCSNCVVRSSVNEAIKGNRLTRRRTKMQLFREQETVEIYALVSASPFTFHGKALALLVIEDISEIAELHRIIPICAICKKVRDDKESWTKVEAFFKDNWDLDFSHGYCPECYEKEMEKLKGLSHS